MGADFPFLLPLLHHKREKKRVFKQLLPATFIFHRELFQAPVELFLQTGMPLFTLFQSSFSHGQQGQDVDVVLLCLFFLACGSLGLFLPGGL